MPALNVSKTMTTTPFSERVRLESAHTRTGLAPVRVRHPLGSFVLIASRSKNRTKFFEKFCAATSGWTHAWMHTVRNVGYKPEVGKLRPLRPL